jgi:hypothetical protein
MSDFEHALRRKRRVVGHLDKDPFGEYELEKTAGRGGR